MPRTTASHTRALLATVLLLVAGSAAALGQAPDAAQRLRLTPEQQQDMLQRMTPEQRAAFRAARTPEERQRAWQGLTPDQRSDMWQRFSPEQRELLMRRLPPEERRQAWERMSPADKEAMRQRFIERREQRIGSGAVPGASLSPEERQRLRDQIRDAQRDVYGNRNKGGPTRDGNAMKGGGK